MSNHSGGYPDIPIEVQLDLYRMMLEARLFEEKARRRFFDGPRAATLRTTTPHIPMPSADTLEDLVMPSVERIAGRIHALVGA